MHVSDSMILSPMLCRNDYSQEMRTTTLQRVQRLRDRDASRKREGRRIQCDKTCSSSAGIHRRDYLPFVSLWVVHFGRV